jgi:phosphatidylinositol glycan class B
MNDRLMLISETPCRSLVSLLSTILDYALTGTWNIPGLSFFAYNILFDISRFYGTSPWHYHLLQSLPILTTTSLPFVLPTFVKALSGFPLAKSESDLRQDEDTLRTQDYNVGLLAKAAFGAGVAYSLIPHKEWRFLHPLLPVLLIFGAHTLVAAYKVNPSGGLLGSKLKTLCAGFRIGRRPFLFLSLTPVLPWLYLTFVHGRAQVKVTEWLGEQARLDPQLEAMFLMPCHATPWMSHAHVKDRIQADGWRFLTCDPPVE